MTDAATINPQNETAAKSKEGWAMDLASRGIGIHPLVFTLPDGSCSCGSKPDADGKLFIPGTKDKCSPGKHPASAHGVHDATSEAAKIKAWFKNEPRMNYGVAAGNGLAIIDLDKKNGKDGYKSMEDYLNAAKERQHPVTRDLLLSSTFAVETTTGGAHLYFLADEAYSNRAGILSGVDVRSAGGYVVGPGSIIHMKDEFGAFYAAEYKVINDAPLCKMPQSIAALLTLSKERAENAGESMYPDDIDSDRARYAARKALERFPVAVEGEGGNDQTYAAACQARDCNVSKEVCFDLMTEPGGWNERCKPQWEDGELVGLIDHGYKYAKGQMGNRYEPLPDLMELFGLDGLEDSELPPDFNEANDNRDSDSAGSAQDGKSKKRKSDQQRSVSQSFHDIGELKAKIGITTPLVRGWLQEGFMNGILARRGGGKTTVLVDLCMAGQADEKWFGVLSIKHGYTFVYIALEDQTGVVQTCEAWQAKHPEIRVNPRRFKILDYPLNVLASNRDQTLKEICDYVRTNMDHEKVCFVIDTFQRAATASQTDDDKMVDAVGHIEEFAKSFDRGLCVVAFQPPKSGTMTILGAGQLENMCGVKIDLNYDESTGPDGDRVLFVDRIKGAERGNSLKFKVVGQEIEGTDDFGNPNTGPVVVYRGGEGDAAKHMAELREDNQILAEDVAGIMGGGEYSLNKVAIECGGKDGGAYGWLPRSLKVSRRLPGREGLKKRLMAMAGHVWPLDNGLWELEVIVPAGMALMAKTKGPGNGVKVIIRECLKVGPE